MKALLFLLAVGGLIYVVAQKNRGDSAPAVVTATSVPASTPQAAPSAATEPAKSVSASHRTVSTYDPQLHRWIDHDPSVSARTSAGLNAYTGPPRDPATPEPGKFQSTSSLNRTPGRR